MTGVKSAKGGMERRASV